MVLTNSIKLTALGGLAAAVAAMVVALSGCPVKQTPVQRLAQATPITLAIAHEGADGWTGSVPAHYRKSLDAALEARNIGTLTPGMDRILSGQITEARLRTLAEGSPTDVVILIETSSRYDSQLSGRYRWQVYAKLTIAKKAELSRAVTNTFDVPVVLDYDHQRHSEALAGASGPIADRLGRLVDSFFASYGNSASTPPAPTTRQANEQNEVIYFVLVDRFHNGDRTNDGSTARSDPHGWHGGDLRGVIDKLEYIQDLGATSIWLSPVFKTRTDKHGGHGAFHGYWTYDLAKVEPRFGTEADLVELATAMRARGMKLYLDMVLNHVGPDAPLLSQKPAWFHRNGDITDWNDSVQLTDNDVHGLPDLAQENDEVYQYLLSASAGWLRKVRPAGFRIDAVKHARSGFWKRYNTDIRAAASTPFAILGEMYDGNVATVARAEAAGAFDGMFDFPLYFALTDAVCKKGSPAGIAAILFEDRRYNRPGNAVTFVDNHDLPRVRSLCGDPVRTRSALRFVLSARGTPAITYGTESFLAGAKEPHNRADMRFSNPSPLRAWLKRRIAQRELHPALIKGAPYFVTASDSRFVYARVTRKQVALISVVADGSIGWKMKLPPELASLRFYDPERQDPEHHAPGRKDRRRSARLVLGSDIAPGAGVRVFLSAPDTPASAIAPLLRAINAPPAMRTITFTVQAPTNAPPPTLAIVGSGTELGDWDPKKAPRATFKDGRYHAALSLPARGVFSYKLVLLADSGGKDTWERGKNRTLFVAPDLKTLDLSWQASN